MLFRSIEDQAYPFEEKAISVHEKNMELLDVGIYNQWIDKSIAKLSLLLPARYGKTETDSVIVSLIQPEKAKQIAPETDKTGKISHDGKQSNSNKIMDEISNDEVIEENELVSRRVDK